MRTLAFVLTAAGLAAAMCPPCSRDPREIQIVDAQRVFVFHRGGMEDLILQSSYKGKGSDFGMILPLPDVPEVRMVRQNFCDEIAKIAQEPDLRVFAEEARSLQKDGAGKAKDIEVLKKEIAGVFEAVTLKARKVDALRKWLKENGYSYVDDGYADKVFQSYIDKEWVFVAIRVNVENRNVAFDGAFRPMGLRFRSRDVVVPTKVASIYPTGMPFAIYVITNTPVNFPKSWGDGRVTTFALDSEQLLRSKEIRRELEADAILDRTGALKKLAEGIRKESAEKYEEFLARKLSGLYLTKFAGHFSREQLATGDLVFERESLINEEKVDGYVKDLQSGDLAKVKLARRVLSAAGVGHVKTLAKHLRTGDPQLRIALATTLAMIGDLEAVPYLIEALEKEEDRLAKSAIDKSLRELTGYAETNWRAWWEKVEK